MPRSPIFWGAEAKSRTVQDFSVTAISHYKLLPGEKIAGECGTLENRCYVIELKSKSNPEDKELYNVGYRVAQGLLDLTNQPYLNPPFDVMRVIGGPNGANRTEHARNNNVNAPSFMARLTPLNREFFDAIHIVIIAWKVTKPTGLLKSCLTYLKDVPHRDTDIRFIQKFNNALSKDSQNRTLRIMLSEIQEAHGTTRDFQFPIMNEILGDDSNIG